jgi:hypothetical protein
MGKPVGAKEFFEEMMNEEEYYIIMAHKETDYLLFEQIEGSYTLTVRVKNDAYKDDPEHKLLARAKSKASKGLERREFEINQNK